MAGACMRDKSPRATRRRRARAWRPRHGGGRYQCERGSVFRPQYTRRSSYRSKSPPSPPTPLSLTVGEGELGGEGIPKTRKRNFTSVCRLYKWDGRMASMCGVP